MSMSCRSSYVLFLGLINYTTRWLYDWKHFFSSVPRFLYLWNNSVTYFLASHDHSGHTWTCTSMASFTRNHLYSCQPLQDCGRKLSEIRLNVTRCLRWHSDFTKFNVGHGAAQALTKLGILWCFPVHLSQLGKWILLHHSILHALNAFSVLLWTPSASRHAHTSCVMYFKTQLLATLCMHWMLWLMPNVQ